MTETIWKFEIEVDDKIKIEMPKNSEILCVQVQNGKPCIWAKVIKENSKEIRFFTVFGTGHEIKEHNLNYIGTFQLFEGRFVGHLFEIKP